jgi:hypothetical protein
MKKKYRKIIVDGIIYGWTIRNDCDGDYNNCLTIWKDKKIINQQIIKGGIDITPKFVSDIIKSIINENF